MARRRVIAILVVFIAILAVALVWRSNPTPALPGAVTIIFKGAVTVTFKGYTNDTSGQQVASFVISNLSSGSINVRAEYVNPQKRPKGPISPIIPSSRLSQGVLRRGQYRAIAFPKPKVEGPWKLAVVYSKWEWRDQLTSLAASKHVIRWVPSRLLARSLDETKTEIIDP